MNIRTSMASLSALVIIFFAASVHATHAAYITDSQVQEQKRTVLVAVVDTLEAQLKLIQMLYIQKLEARVAYLESLT
jgi:hypothetical protein